MNPKVSKEALSLSPIPVAAKIWSQVGIDIIGLLQEATSGNKLSYKRPFLQVVRSRSYSEQKRQISGTIPLLYCMSVRLHGKPCQ